jgi:hypothetical protein
MNKMQKATSLDELTPKELESIKGGFSSSELLDLVVVTPPTIGIIYQQTTFKTGN